MLSTNSSSSSSSIQKRRQQHRRQQSLEVPILATPLPANPRRRPAAHHAHRRGLSLDQSLSALHSPTGFRPLLPQDHTGPSGSQSVRIQLDTTNLGPPPTQQHFVQETQQQRPNIAQPGYPPQDFQSHLQQQLRGSANSPIDFKPVIASPQPQDPRQQVALQELQHHMAWYSNNYGVSPNNTMPATSFFNGGPPSVNDMPGATMPASTPVPMMQAQVMPQTPVSGHARTVPNTPQTYTQAWPSPPPSNVKHARSQSFQLDVAPMPDSTGNSFAATSFTQPTAQHGQDSAAFGSDADYASSAYSVSVADAMSPGRQQHLGPMPTLFEEPNLTNSHLPLSHMPDSLLLQAAAGAHDFEDPEFDFEGPMLLSPGQQLLNNLGPDVPASIVATGVDAYEVQHFIGELSAADNKYPCLYSNCGRRFGRKENVRAHVQTHLGDRQFKCNLCDKTFVRQHDLKRHIAIHSEDRPFVCPCGTGFARHDALTRHRQRGMCSGALPGFEKTEEEKPKRGRPKKERVGLDERTDKASKQRKKNKAKHATFSGGIDEESEVQIIYASSSSGASDRSFPVTPPDTSDTFDADAFLNMANGHIEFDNVASQWRDTPPTSPVSGSPTKTADSIDPSFDFNAPLSRDLSISPAMLSTHSSPPASTGAVANSTHTPESDHDFFDCVSPSGSNGAAGGSFMGGSSPTEADMDLYDLLNQGGTVQPQPDVNFDAFSPPGESNGSSSVYNYSEHDTNMFDKELSDFVTAAPSSGIFATSLPGMDDSRSLGDMLDEWIATN